MKRILFVVLSLLIMTSSFMEVSASAETPANAFIDTKINTNMYYFNAKKTVVNDKGIAVSISESGSLATCEDLAVGDWEITTFDKNMEFNDIIVVDNKFMAVAAIGADSLLLSSSDGINWTEEKIKGYYIMKMFHINDSYFIIAIDPWRQYAIFKTKDFQTFERIESQNDIGMNIYPKADEVNLYISDIAYFKGRYFLCGMYDTGDPRSFDSDYCKGTIISSQDLNTWKVCTESPTILRDMVQSNDTLIAYGGSSYSARLSDANQISSMGSGGIPETNMVYSNDGEKFNVCNISFETNAGAFDIITFTGGKFFGITYKKIGISSDGISWITRSEDVDWKYGGYYNGKHIAVGADIHNNNRKVMAASAGNSVWKITESSTNFSEKTRLAIASFAMESSGYYILSEDSTDISSDLVNWKSNLGNELNRYKKILFDGKRFVAITEDSVISSPDGAAWQTNYEIVEGKGYTSPKFNDMYFLNGKYYIYGIKWGQEGNGWECHVWIGEDLTNWEEYKLHIDNYIENANADLNNIRVSVIGDKAVLTHNSLEKAIIAVSDDMYNFTPIMTDYSKWNLGKLYYYNNRYVAFATEAAKTEDLSSNPFYTVSKASGFKDYIYISHDLKTFKKVELPSQHIKDIYFFKDSFILAAHEYPKFKLYITKDFKEYESYEIPTEYSSINLTGSEEGIYNIFSIDDVLYITGARVMYTKNFKDWTILDSLPVNGYMSFATRGSQAVVGGHGIMIRILQNNSALK
ncbi:hypothetical protein [Lutispora saccharofermentans]|uniref:Uncharacterized protein n=1 Tax=Lutispora saccharofermentans TaxID=3024236 RepID=A0ABT1NJL5_9FIRM|nr:hypothetical protein [Lutispora saccharofermentans]MCQ1531434.1 hypothetical protein [Lutispora saccharofermentans]